MHKQYSLTINVENKFHKFISKITYRISLIPFILVDPPIRVPRTNYKGVNF